MKNTTSKFDSFYTITMIIVFAVIFMAGIFLTLSGMVLNFEHTIINGCVVFIGFSITLIGWYGFSQDLNYNRHTQKSCKEVLEVDKILKAPLSGIDVTATVPYIATKIPKEAYNCTIMLNEDGKFIYRVSVDFESEISADEELMKCFDIVSENKNQS